jgi:hypothetical protein
MRTFPRLVQSRLGSYIYAQTGIYLHAICNYYVMLPLEKKFLDGNVSSLGTISSSNPTAQPADVLIQSAPPHRRARTPAWSYHFYPDETWVDLTLSLPCAVLLKEVQLQPHLTSLASKFLYGVLRTVKTTAYFEFSCIILHCPSLLAALQVL